jgi:predicted metal-dependent phosphoesterase TrpH
VFLVRPAKRRKKNFLRRVTVVSMFVIALLWLGTYLHFVVESRRNAELKIRDAELSRWIEELTEEINRIKESRTR